MANINFGLLDTQYPEKLANAFVRSPEQQNANMLQAMQMKHLIDQSDQAQYAINKARREDTGLAAFGAGLKALGPDPSPDAVAQLFMAHPSPEMQKAGLGMLQEARASAAYGKLAPMGGATTAPAAAPASPFTANMMANRAALPSFGDNQLAATAGAAPASAPAATRESQIAQLEARLTQVAPLARYSPEAKAEQARITDRIKELSKPQVLAQGGTFIPGPGLASITAPEATSQEIRTMQALGYPNTQAGYTAFRDAQRQDRLLTPAEEEQRIRIAGASRAPAQPRPEQPPVAVVDPRTGKTVYVSREEALRDRMTPANATEGLAPKEIQKREAALPAATSAVNGFETKSKSFVKDLEALRDHPGLASITGIAAGRLPGLTSDGRAAQALYDKIVAKGGFQALQDLRDASKTGGALGNVSNQEGKQLTASFAAIDRRQDAADVKAAIDQAISDVNGARTRTREAYDSTYSYKNAAGQAAPAGAGKPSLDSIFGKKNP